MFTYKSTAFSFAGFIMVLTAAFLSGIRWTFSQLIMQKSKLGLSNPIDFIYHIQPLMVMSLLPIAIGVEGKLLKQNNNWHLTLFPAILGVDLAASKATFRTENMSDSMHTLNLILFGGILAFCMEVAEFMVIRFTSSLTLSIIGVVKVRSEGIALFSN